MPTIAERIRQGLELRRMKQSELVEATGIGKSSISTYISGAYEPKQKNIYLIAKALDVNEAWLMGHDVPMEKEKPTPVSESGLDAKTEQLLLSFEELTPENQAKLIELARLYVEDQKRRQEGS